MDLAYRVIIKIIEDSQLYGKANIVHDNGMLSGLSTSPKIKFNDILITYYSGDLYMSDVPEQDGGNYIHIHRISRIATFN